MRSAFLGSFGAGLVSTLALVVVAACSDAPAEPVVGSGSARIAEPAFNNAAGPKTKVKDLHFARVRSDGTLVDGTALSAERLGPGDYRLTFEEPIDGCAASANSAAFPGFDQSVLRVSAQISIGLSSGPTGVVVSLFDLDGNSVDSSFTLTLVCPLHRGQ